MYTYSSGGCSYKEPIKKECIVLVGLPARGKSYISNMLCRYLNWNGHSTKIFNVGNYRRLHTDEEECKYDFFDPNNEICYQLRNKFAQLAMNDLIYWLMLPSSRIAIFDATNTTYERRKWIYETCKQHNIRVFYIESICNDEKIVENIIRNVKLSSPDYIGKSANEALDDFRKRIENYQKVYEEISPEFESHYSFIKIINTGKNLFINNLTGFLQPKVAYFLMHTHLMDKTIYITRHGESEYNRLGKIGGDSDLSENGYKYSKLLGQFIHSQGKPHLRVLTSNMKRTILTAAHVCAKRHELKALDEIDAGICDGMTYEEISHCYPDEYKARLQNKYNYRYPRGESYVDVINRLETVILEIERLKNVLIITHQAVARCILAYLCDISSENIPYIEVPLHTVFAISPKSYGISLKASLLFKNSIFNGCLLGCKAIIYTFDVNNNDNPVKIDEKVPSLIQKSMSNLSICHSLHYEQAEI